MSQSIKRPFCLDDHRVIDLAAFVIIVQSFETETLTEDTNSDILGFGG